MRGNAGKASLVIAGELSLEIRGAVLLVIASAASPGSVIPSEA